jgi:hypothetical protein
MDVGDSVRLAILNVQKESVTDVDAFSRPFEIDFLRERPYFELVRDIVQERIRLALAAIKGGKEPFEGLRELKVSPVRAVLVPKKTLFDFRQGSVPVHG